ncbi:MAG TPA: low affinity iron permease family protein [Rudaea sp.]|jgi:low affinity Fe/Cu permease|nr:low affinity iron permease family protein [Rudaea sp.]
MKKKSLFTRFTQAAARATGRPIATILALGVLVVWAATGPVFHYSDTWQLVINTGTSLVTFLMVFLIQSSQNRDTEALQIKLDELIRAVEPASNTLLNLEELEEQDLDELRDKYQALAEKARQLADRAKKKKAKSA